MTPYIIGIAGGSGSGKTTFAHRIIESLQNESVQLIQHDSYYKDIHDLSFEERAKTNFDHPDALETTLLVQHLKALKRGETIHQPQYDFSTHLRLKETIKVSPKPIIIIDGILIFVDEQLRNEMNLKIFIDTDEDIRLMRRIERDTKERGRSLESIREQYFSTVKPMYDAFVGPSKHYADLVIPNNFSLEVASEVVVSALNKILQQ